MSRRPRRIKRSRRNTRTQLVWNRERIKIAPFKKTIIASFTVPTAGIAGPYNAFYVFDPSGTHGNTGGTIPGTPIGIADWGSMAALYHQYKVAKIKLTFRAFTTATADGQYPSIITRYMYDPDYVPGLAALQQQSNVVLTRFAPECPNATFTVYPKMLKAVGAVAGASLQQGLTYVKMPWTDCTRPISLYGFALSSELVANGFGWYMDVEYYIKFRDSR